MVFSGGDNAPAVIRPNIHIDKVTRNASLELTKTYHRE